MHLVKKDGRKEHIYSIYFDDMTLHQWNTEKKLRLKKEEEFVATRIEKKNECKKINEKGLSF